MGKTPRRCSSKPTAAPHSGRSKREYGAKGDLPALSICRLEAPEDLCNALKQHIDDPALANYTCPICWEPFWQPVRTVCGHAFCEGCLLKAVLMQLSQGTADVSCPLCRHHLHVDDVTADQALLTRMRLILSERRREGRATPSGERGSRCATDRADPARCQEARQRPATSSGSMSARNANTARQQWASDEGRLTPTPVRMSPVPWGIPGSRPATVGAGCSRTVAPWHQPEPGEMGGPDSTGNSGSWLVVTSRCSTALGETRPQSSQRQRETRRVMPPTRPASRLQGRQLHEANLSEAKGQDPLQAQQELSVDVRAAQLRIRPSTVSGATGSSRSWWCSSAGRNETFSTFGSLALASALAGPPSEQPEQKHNASGSTPTSWDTQALPQVPAHVGSGPRPRMRATPQRSVLAWH
mmetsp:Transcript_35464/g.64976  ORF Transcript_35464/g.64976 Transcript_35464/m.64976 type:complete len:412 (-) Transcript_35464:83-1318(-)